MPPQIVLSRSQEMSRNVNAIVGRVSMRLPQRPSLEILEVITETAAPKKEANIDLVFRDPYTFEICHL